MINHDGAAATRTGPGSRLKRAIAGQGVAQIMAAHSPLSALLAEEAGFDGLWISGFELSALYGLPDAGLVSMSRHLEMTRAIAGRTGLPVIADLDTGFGNAINVIHAIRHYEQAGAAGVVIEDKSFPKMTSLIAGGRQELVRIAEFEGKIAAALSARRDPDFLVIARTEALIAGLGVAEALARAAAYDAVGADLILVHSRQTTSDEIEGFVCAWTGRAPIVLVPTSYPDLTLDRARALGRIAMIIHGNHAIRAAVAGMRTAFAAIRRAGGSGPVEPSIATVQDIFRLQDMAGLQRDEARFLR